MQALVKESPGPGHVGIRELSPRAPGPDELLIKVRYCGICGTDLHIAADEFPNSPPVTMGHEYVGVVAQGGENVAGAWREGERVVGETHTGACGVCHLCRQGRPHICPHKRALGSRHDGAFAEYLTVPAWLVHRVPDGVPDIVAAVTEPFAIAGHCLVERGAVAGARTALVTGSSTIGLLATLWLRRLGVGEIIVAGVARDVGQRFALARALGATQTVSVEREDLADVVARCTAGEGVDAWVECSGAPSAIRGGIGLVKRAGKAVLIGLVGPEQIPIPWNTLLYGELDVVGCFSSPPSSWRLALAAAREEQDRLRRLVTAILPLSRWEEGFAMMRRGEGVKILLDMQA